MLILELRLLTPLLAILLNTYCLADMGFIKSVCVCVCVCECTHAVCSVTKLCPILCDLMDSSPPASLSMEFSHQEYWSGLPFPPPGDRPDPGIKLKSPASTALTGGFFTTEPPGKYL